MDRSKKNLRPLLLKYASRFTLCPTHLKIMKGRTPYPLSIRNASPDALLSMYQGSLSRSSLLQGELWTAAAAYLLLKRTNVVENDPEVIVFKFCIQNTVVVLINHAH